MSNWLRILLCILCFYLPVCGHDVRYFPETAENEVYLAKMPWELYKPYYVPTLGYFWLDDAKDCIKTTLKEGKVWEPYIINHIKKYLKPGNSAIDIGSHIGTISFAMSNIVGDTGQVYSFEGERQVFREFLENIKSSKKRNIFPHFCWLSNEDKTLQTKSWPGSGYSPVRPPDNGSYQLEVYRLDSFCLQNIDLMKIDVECTEDAVLEGAYETIMSSRPVIIIEIMGGFGHDNSENVRTRIEHTKNKLKEMGYDVEKIWVDDYLAIPIEKK